jgi:hypothetical protein
MRSLILSAALVVALSAPALAADYPVSGRWGVSTSSTKGAIDCTGKRVISFSGNQRRDSGGIPAYRNLSVTPAEQAHYRVVDEFTNGQISAGRVYYTLVMLDADHIELQMQQGGTLKLQRCK